MSRGVIVQPSVYGTDNRATKSAVAEGGENFWDVIVVNEDVTLKELQDLYAKGARDAPINVIFQSDALLNDVQQFTRTLAATGFHHQMLTDASKFGDLKEFVRGLPVLVVFDHFEHRLENDLVHDGLIAQSVGQRAEFWNWREYIPETNRLIGAVSSHDVSLPLGNLPTFIKRVSSKITINEPLRINCFGHLGDGKFFSLFSLPRVRHATLTWCTSLLSRLLSIS